MHNTSDHPLMLSRAECQVLRGLAILGIMLHNYCHWLGPIVRENEYTYTQHNVDVLGQVLAHPDLNLPMHLLSFFGHYGVPVFLFLSAYGLVLKYERGSHGCPHNRRGHPDDPLQCPRHGRDEPSPRPKRALTTAVTSPHHGRGEVSSDGLGLPSVSRFVGYHYLKLFKMMIVGFVAFTMVDAITPGRWHYTVLQVVAQLGMFNNLLPDPDHQIWPGPYWFFGLMLQLYVVYRVALCRRHWGITAALMAVCVALQLVLAPEGDALNCYRYNFMGGMLPFGLGLLYARYAGRLGVRHIAGSVWGVLTIAGCLLIYATSLSYVPWAFTPALVCVAAVAVVKWLGCWGSQADSWLWSALVWVGQVSAALFVCHPLLRKVFIPISRGGDLYTGLLLYAIASLCVAWLFAQLMSKIPNPRLR